ncbi:MAG TPA: CheR family methyltransferase, partial [Candidatus Binatia bacterium]|nr:CheR family methyltransferase [Candidatus Binatia bacterium]
MHKLLATSTILEHDLSELRLLVERQTGLVLDCPNSALAAHVIDYIEAQGIGSSAALMESLRSSDNDPQQLAGMLDGIVNTNSGFFRHPGALNALAKFVVPQICARKSADGPAPLRLWSAGCATGEEAYSIAISVCDALAQMSSGSGTQSTTNGNAKARTGGIAESAPASTPVSTGWSIHVVGSDLLPRNIETADRGVYRYSALDGLPPAMIRSYFSKFNSPKAVAGSGEDEPRSRRASERVSSANSNNGDAANPPTCATHLLVKPRLRSLVTFNCMNLARPGYIGRFDCIFCMDVLPHFSRPQR